MGKPYDGQDCGGAFFNYPLAYDATGTPNTSPIAGGATVNLKVPRTAGRLNLLATGSNPATVVVKKGTTAQSGSITIPNNVQVQIDCGGMNVSDTVPVLDVIAVTAGATSPVSFWFDCETHDGKGL